MEIFIKIYNFIYNEYNMYYDNFSSHIRFNNTKLSTYFTYCSSGIIFIAKYVNGLEIKLNYYGE
jgi:hypothetical protein